MWIYRVQHSHFSGFKRKDKYWYTVGNKLEETLLHFNGLNQIWWNAKKRLAHTSCTLRIYTDDLSISNF